MTNSLSPEFLVRAPTIADADAVAELVNLCAAAQIGRGMTNGAMVRSVFQEPGRNLTTDNWVVLTPDQSIIAYLEFHDDEAQLKYFYGRVHPTFTGRGIGNYLSGLAEERARPALERFDHVVLQSDVWSNDLAARRLFERAGYARVRAWRRMTIEMEDPPPAPQLPEGIMLAPFIPNRDERALWEAWEEAQGDEWGHTPLTLDEWIYYKVTREENFDPTLWFIAKDGDQIAGYIICRWERPGEPTQGHARDLGVRRAWRRRGIALALLRQAFGEFYRRGKPNVSLGVDATSLTGAERLYERAGMELEAETLIYEKKLTRGDREMDSKQA